MAKLSLKRLNSIQQNAQKYIDYYGDNIERSGDGVDPPTPKETIALVTELKIARQLLLVAKAIIEEMQPAPALKKTVKKSTKKTVKKSAKKFTKKTTKKSTNKKSLDPRYDWVTRG